MNKLWKQTMALFLAFALVFGTLVPVVAWAEEPANVGEPSVEASEPEASLEEETQAEPEESRPEAETEGKATEAPEELELSEEKTPDAQGEPEDPANIFVLTKRAYNDSNAPEEKIGEYKTLKEAVMGCTQDDLDNLYIITMYGDYMVPDAEKSVERGSLHYLLRSAGASPHTLKKEGTDTVFALGDNNTLEVQNVILDGNNDGQCFFMWGNAEVTLGEGTVVQNFVDTLDRDGPAIYMRGTSTLTIEPGAVIQNNKSDQTDAYSAGVIYAAGNSTVNIKGGEFTNNRSNGKDGGVIRSASNAIVNISGGTFKNNSAKRLGGVIQAYGEVNITRGTFEGNKASTGGVIYAKKLKIENATFQSNKANYAGAVDSTEELTITNSHFENNVANEQGGAIYTQANTTITNTSFSSNIAMKDGGAIFRDVNKAGVDTNIVIKNSSFEKNKAANFGGAVIAKAATTIQDTSFTQNEAKVGGAVYTKSNITLKNSTFDSNTAEKWGGAVFCTENTKNTIENSDFESNHAEKWGGAIFSNGELDVSGTSFTKNEANDGGAVLAIAKAKLSKNTFTSNHATELGGAVVVVNVADIANTTFESNKAQNGGAIAISSKDAKVDIKESAFKKNYAEHQGGAISDAAAQYEPKITDPKAYRNLTTDAKTLFQGNKADGGLFNPPKNYEDFTNLQFDPRSDVTHGKLTRASLLNNYDVNYDNNMRTITYDANGGRFDDGMRIKTEEHSLGANIQIMEAPTRRGYTFKYWKGSEYQPGDPYTVKDHHTFVAQWEKDEKTPQPPMTEQIIVDPNGGTFSDGTTGRKTYDLKVGETFLLPDAPTREGYKFISWQSRDAEYQPGYPYIVNTGGEVFTAQWEEEKKPEEKPSVTPKIKTPKGTPLTPDEIAKILAGMKKTIPAIPRAGVGK